MTLGGSAHLNSGAAVAVEQQRAQLRRLPHGRVVLRRLDRPDPVRRLARPAPDVVLCLAENRLAFPNISTSRRASSLRCDSPA